MQHNLRLQLLLLVATFPFVTAQNCPPSDTSASPQFVCDHTVSITLLSDCTARIIETLIYPHTTQGDITRSLSTRSGTPAGIQVTLDDDKVDTKLDQNDRDELLQIEIPTGENSNPVALVIEYSVANFLQAFVDRCNGNFPTPAPNDNILLWDLGRVDVVINRLDVSVETQRTGRLRWAVATDGEVIDGDLALSRENIREFEAFAVLSGAEEPVCPVQFQCGTGLVAWQIILIGLACVLFVVVLGLFLAIRCGFFIRKERVVAVQS